MNPPPSSPSICPNPKLAEPFRRAPRPHISRPPATIGFFYPTEQVGTIPLYSFFNVKNGDYFYSIRSEERISGYQPRGVAGFVFPKSICGGSPLYRLFNRKKMIHFFTASASERAMAVRSGYKNEGVTGYILPRS